MELTPEQREQIRLLLEEELRAAVRAAAGRGAGAAEVEAVVADRRRVLEHGNCSADDAQHPFDDGRDGGGIG